jgi:uncharacterized protein (DUF1697 family)
MTTYAALLRGINLGSHAKIKMLDLRQIFLDLGYTAVQTYLQSGNVVFTTDDADAAHVARAIEQRITHELDLTVPVLLRSQADLETVCGNNPFLKHKADPAALYVTFLDAEPHPEQLASIDPDMGGADEFSAAGRELYLHCPGGYGRTKLNNNFFERRLKLGATTRNWKTVTKLCELSGA